MVVYLPLYCGTQVDGGTLPVRSVPILFILW